MAVLAALKSQGASTYPGCESDSTAAGCTFADTYQCRALTLATPMIAGGIVAKEQENRFRDLGPGPFAVHNRWYDNVMQYTPAATMFALKLAGVESRSSWGEMLTADAFSAAIMCGTVQLLKNTMVEERPDMSDAHSFPSGHTAMAFMTATMLSHEYGDKYPWLSVAGYGVAAATGFVRVERNKHWAGDVMVGAGIGIISTELGYMISDLIFHRPAMEKAARSEEFEGEYNPSFIGIYMGMSVPTGNHGLTAGNTFRNASGTTVGVEGAWYFCRNFGIGAKGTVSNERFYINDNMPQSTPMRYRTLMAGPYYTLPLSHRLYLGAKVAAGYCRFSGMTLPLGRDESGTETMTLEMPRRSGMALGTGMSLTARMQRHISYRLFCDLDLLPVQHPDHGNLAPALNIGAQVLLDF